MTIQISLVIWTIIGFTVLSLILNKFLFKPLLKVMDARNEKIRIGEEERQAALEREEKIRKANEAARLVRQQEAEELRRKPFRMSKRNRRSSFPSRRPSMTKSSKISAPNIRKTPVPLKKRSPKVLTGLHLNM